MGYLVRAYYSISPTKYYKDDSCWSADLSQTPQKTSSAYEASWKFLFLIIMYLLGNYYVYDDDDDGRKDGWIDWEDQILEDTVPLVGFVRMILHSGNVLERLAFRITVYEHRYIK
ncbi:hypothetical protein Tco_0566770 [Tanacetum coccineum]